MYCSNCGAESETDAQFCATCGKQLPRSDSATVPVQPVHNRAHADSPKKQLYGVRGWLLLLVIGLCFLGPLISLGQMSNQIQMAETSHPALANLPAWATYKTISYWGLAIALALSIAAGATLWTKFVPGSVRFAVGAMWSVAPIVALGQVVAVSSAFGSNAMGASGGTLFVGVLQGWVVALVWTIYLLRSRRVRNTYYKRGV